MATTAQSPHCLAPGEGPRRVCLAPVTTTGVVEQVARLVWHTRHLPPDCGRRRVLIVSPWVSQRGALSGSESGPGGPHPWAHSRAHAPRLPGSPAPRLSLLTRGSRAAPLPGGWRVPLTLETPSGRAASGRLPGIKTTEGLELRSPSRSRPSCQGDHPCGATNNLTTVKKVTSPSQLVLTGAIPYLSVSHRLHFS